MWAHYLDWVVDGLFLIALWGVTCCLGGRLAAGQALLIGCSVLSLCAVGLRTILSPTTSGQISIPTLCFLLMSVGLLWLQTCSLEESQLSAWSPGHTPIMQARQHLREHGVPLAPWRTITFDVSETRSSLATLMAYGGLLLACSLRCRCREDALRYLRWIGWWSLAVAGFSLVHYTWSNGKYFWVFQHPFSNPRRYNVGPFTNRNHLAHVLAIGAACWLWVCLRARRDTTGPQSWRGGAWQSARSSQTNLQQTAPRYHPLVGLWLGMALLWGGILLTQSRGGLLAFVVMVGLSLHACWRCAWISSTTVLGGVCSLGAMGLIAATVGQHTLWERLQHVGLGDRREIWWANLELLRRFPWFGTGAGTHGIAHPLVLDHVQANYEFTHADNCYLQLLSECGFVGGTLGLLFLAFLYGSLRHFSSSSDVEQRCLGGVLLAIFWGHLIHAGFDYLWYVPACMLPLILLMGIVLSLDNRETFHSTKNVAPGAAAGGGYVRFLTGFVCLGSLCCAPWMLAQKREALRGEWDRYHYLNLTFIPWEIFPVDDQPETRRALLEQRVQYALQAAYLQPHQGHLQVIAARLLLDWFDQLSLEQEPRLNLVQLADALQHAGFSSHDEQRAWLQRVLGKRLAILYRAQRLALRGLQQCPLEGKACLILMDLAFLDQPNPIRSRALIKYALQVRPYDPQVLVAAGLWAWKQQNLKLAESLWRRAYKYGSPYRQLILKIVLLEKTIDQIRQLFPLEWQDWQQLVAIAQQLGRDELLPDIRRHLGQAAWQAMHTLDDHEMAITAGLTAAEAFGALNEPHIKLQVLREAVQRFPHAEEIRWQLGRELWSQGLRAEAQKHLVWVARRRPTDKTVQRWIREVYHTEHELTHPLAPTTL